MSATMEYFKYNYVLYLHDIHIPPTKLYTYHPHTYTPYMHPQGLPSCQIRLNCAKLAGGKKGQNQNIQSIPNK